MSDMEPPTVQWGEFHFESRVNAFWDDDDYAISVGRYGNAPFVHVRADQVHNDGLTMSLESARQLAVLLLHMADRAERKGE